MQLVFDFPLQTRYTFDNFVVCSGNRAACHFARQLAEGGGAESVLYIYGPPGCGKTHLLASVADLISRETGRTAPCMSFRDIDNLYRGNYPAEAASLLGERFAGAQALLIDDIHLIPDHASIRVEVWQLFNDFYNAGKRIMVTGLFPPKELPHLDDHMISRLLWGLVARVDITDDESRRMILDKLAEDRQVVLPGEVTEYILKSVRRDVPSLSGALERISCHALSEGRKISLRLAKEVLGI